MSTQQPTEKLFITKGTPEYFAEREARLQAHIDNAKTQIESIEGRCRAELVELAGIRDRIQEHLQGFVNARNELVKHREETLVLISSLKSLVNVCETELPEVDKLLDGLEIDYNRTDHNLADKEETRRKQLNKHERVKARFELRSAHLALRKKKALVHEQPSGAATGENQDAKNWSVGL